MLKNNVTIASLNTGGNVGFNDDAENIANTRRKDTKTNSFGNEDQNSISSADYSDTDSEESRSKSPNARYRLGMNGRRLVGDCMTLFLLINAPFFFIQNYSDLFLVNYQRL